MYEFGIVIAVKNATIINSSKKINIFLKPNLFMEIITKVSIIIAIPI